jgi:hypothetical protein
MQVVKFVLSAPFIEVVGLFLSIVWMMKDQNDRARTLIAIALTVNLFYGALLRFFMGAEGGLLPWKYDFILFQLDSALGVRSTSIARLLQGAWRVPLLTTYQLMVPMMICWFVVTRNRIRGGSVVLAYVAALVTGPVLYAIAPACGPVYAFGTEWLRATPVESGLIRLSGMPNAFPSLHIAAALLLVLFAPEKWSRAVSVVFFGTTLLATISTGEHYVIDLIPGLAFGCFTAQIGFRRGWRSLPNLGITVLWCVLVRFEYGFLISHPFVLRGLAVGTVLIAVGSVVRRWIEPAAVRTPKAAETSRSAPEQPTAVHIASP